jgi:hypothetical protein
MNAIKPLPSRLRRRHFLRGFGGVCVGLPFLEALAPSAKAQAEPIHRFGVFFCCNGVNMDLWFPNGDYGPLTEAHLTGTANEVLAPYVNKLVFPRGIHMAPRGFGRDGGGADDHGKGMAHKLTAQFAEEDDWLALGPSVDHVIASEINPGGRPPFNLRVGRPSTYKSLDYSSYSDSMQAVLGINNPWNAYSDLVNLGGGDADAPAASDLVSNRRQSVLDLVSEQFAELDKGPLSASDRQKLDAHFTAIREIEVAVTTAGAISCADTSLAERAQVYEAAETQGGDGGFGGGFAPPLVEQDSEYAAVTDLQIDIMTLALACDAMRVVSLQFGSGSGGPIFTWDGMAHEYNHHKLSHGKVKDNCFGDSTENGCDDVVGWEGMIADIDVWHQGKFARLLERLESYVEEDGSTLLDNSLILYTNELSDGKGHSYMDLPYILAGSAGGVFKQGEYVRVASEGFGDGGFDEDAPHNKLLNTIVNAMGIESDWFGVPEGQGGETMQGGVYEQLLA